MRCQVVSRWFSLGRATGTGGRVTGTRASRARAASAAHDRDRDDEHVVLLVRGTERAAHREIFRRFRQKVPYVHIQRLLLLRAWPRTRPYGRPPRNTVRGGRGQGG